MGFITGFTGGVTLTLGITYLAISAHQNNRQSQSAILRSQAQVLDSLSQDPSTRRRRSRLDPPPPHHPSPTATLITSAKDKWNSELSSLVHRAQTASFTTTRESAERALGLALDSEAAHIAQETAHSVSSSLSSARSEATHHLSQTRDTLVSSASEARHNTEDMVTRTIEKGKHMLGKAKARIHLAEERAEARVDAKLLHVSEIEKALGERFERGSREEVMKKSVEEVLKERYTPIGERDNSRLRGL